MAKATKWLSSTNRFVDNPAKLTGGTGEAKYQGHAKPSSSAVPPSTAGANLTAGEKAAASAIAGGFAKGTRFPPSGVAPFNLKQVRNHT